jgi:hypothetical protein
VSHQTRLHPRSTVIVVHSILGRPIVPSLGSRWPRHYTQRSVAVDAALPLQAETGNWLMTEQSTILPAKYTRLLATQVHGICGELGPGIWKLQRLISLYLEIYKRVKDLVDWCKKDVLIDIWRASIKARHRSVLQS